MTRRKIVIKARLILYDHGRILLLKQTKPNGGNYSLVGGTVEAGELAKASLIRESKEEAGILLKATDLTLVHVLHQKKGKKEDRITLYFRAARWEGKLRARETDKFKDARWFSLEKLPENITPKVRQALRYYRLGVYYSEMNE
ncbi:MAG: NUDIX domain-containing protein [Bacteroidetes bacterium]|nr:MAG: NUDIX domain-containing protein [Bacteroidota bacterium]